MFQLIPYLNFNGRSAEVIAFYQQALGAEVLELMHWRDMPSDEPMPEAMANLVMYSRLSIGGQSVCVSDMPPSMTAEPGDAFSILIDMDDVELLERSFAALAEGGEIRMPLTDTFWNARHGKVMDRFGVQWMFNCQKPAAP